MSKVSQNKRVLIVDDDIDFLIQTETRLKNAGFEVLKAESQKEAEELLKKKKPDIAILDLMMEHVDAGFSLSYYIKKIYPDVPVIIVTAVTSETGMDFDASTEEEKSWIKADVLLQKPIRFEQLLREINRLLEKK